MDKLARCSAAATASAVARMLLLSLVLALLGGAGHAVDASVCDTANCGKGNCSETPGLLPSSSGYECHCDPGWSNAVKFIPFSPCIVPNCSMDSACLKLNGSGTPEPPTSKLDVCAVASCGAGGACKPGGAPFSYSCECQPGYANLLNLTTLPCVNCFLGAECYALGLGGPPPATAPSGDHGPSGPSPPPSGTKGSVSSPSLVQLLLLLLVSAATVQVV